MFKPLVMGGNKRLGPDDPRISEIADAVQETTCAADFKSFFTLFGHQLRINHLGLDLIGLVQYTSFIHIATIAPDTLFFTLDIKLSRSKIGGRQLVLVVGLKMITYRISQKVLTINLDTVVCFLTLTTI